jgi:hypothetical protein
VKNISFDAAADPLFDEELDLSRNPAACPVLASNGRIAGWIYAEIHRKDGSVEIPGWSRNGITNEGFNNMLGVHFHGDTQQSSWYALLISTSSFTALAATDVMNSHTGWTESVAYTEGTRTQILFNASASKSISNTTTCDFSISVDATVIKGIGVTSNNTKSGTTGKLWATGLFSSDQTLNNGDILKITYQVNLS